MNKIALKEYIAPKIQQHRVELSPLCDFSYERDTELGDGGSSGSNIELGTGEGPGNTAKEDFFDDEEDFFDDEEDFF